jgi:hypothetical protein
VGNHESQLHFNPAYFINPRFQNQDLGHPPPALYILYKHREGAMAGIPKRGLQRANLFVVAFTTSFQNDGHHFVRPNEY